MGAKAGAGKLSAIKRTLMWLSVLALVIGTLPLYAIAPYNHPYYDDYGFSASVRRVWRDTGSVSAALNAAVENAQSIRQTWQGTYTGTLLSNVQPGVFSESLYYLSNFFLLTAFLVCFGVFYGTVFGALGLARGERVTLACLCMTLTIQFMPDMGEAFFWFNGGVGNTFIYSLLALAVALGVRLLRAKTRGTRAALTAALAVLMVLLGGGSYGGGLFGLCGYALVLVALFCRRHPQKWRFAALFAVFAACFLYNMSAPGNSVRAWTIGYQAPPARAVVQALYYGVMQTGTYIRLPLIAITLLLLPFIYRAAGESRLRFAHPWLCLLLMGGLYCTQLAPPLYSIAGIGDGRIENTYFESFVCMWFLYVYYLAGFAARRLEKNGALKPTLSRFGAGAYRGLALASACMLAVGCLAWKLPGDELYGVQNMGGVSAALSILSGEAAQYDREMDEREALLNDPSLPQVTLKPLTTVPRVFMEDMISSSLAVYYGKEAIHIEGEVDAP